MVSKEDANNAVMFTLKWLAISVIGYFGWTKLAPWVDGILPF